LPFNLWQSNKSKGFLNRFNDWLSAGKNNFHLYSLLVQKQPGSVNQFFQTKLLIPDSYYQIQHSSSFEANENYLNRDKFFSDLISNK